MRNLMLSCLLMVGLCSFAWAQDEDEPKPPMDSGVRFGLHGNVTNFNVGGGTTANLAGKSINFSGQLKDIYGLGLGGGLHLDFKITLLSLRLSADYITMSPDKSKYETVLQQYLGAAASNVAVSGGRIDVYTGSLNAKLVVLPIPVLNPYITGGIGLVRLTTTEASVTYQGSPIYTLKPLEDQTRTATNVGVGVDLAFGGVALFGELRITWIFTKGETSAQVPLGIIGLTF